MLFFSCALDAHQQPRFICFVLICLLIAPPAVFAAEADCWEKTDDAALKACTEIIETKSNSEKAQDNGTVSRAYFQRGSAYFIKRNYAKAIADYDQAIRLNPRYLKAYHIRGNAYMLLENYEQALADFDKVLEIDPTYKAVTYYRGVAQKKIRELAEEAE